MPQTLVPIEVDTFNENDSNTVAERKGAKGNIAETQGSESVQEMSAPELSGDVSDQVIGFILAGLFGDLATTDDSPEAGVNTHALAVENSNNHPTYSIVFADPDINGGAGEYRVCKGCVIDSGEIPLDPGAFAKFDVKFMGQHSETTTDPNENFIDENFFTTPKAVFKLATNVAGLAAADALDVRSGKLIFAKKGTQIFGIGNGKGPAKSHNGRLDIRSELTLEYKDKTYIDLGRGDAERAVGLTLESGATIGSATNPTISFELPKCKIRELSRSRGLEEELRQSFALICEDVMNATGEIVNTHSGYVAD